MESSPKPLSAVDRARWLAELAFAVDQAQGLAREIGAAEDKRRDAQELNAQLESIRVELEMLRRGRAGEESREIDPEWMKLLGWNGSRTG